MLDLVCNPVLRCSKQRVKSFIICYCTYMDRKIEYFIYNHVDTITLSMGTVM